MCYQVLTQFPGCLFDSWTHVGQINHKSKDVKDIPLIDYTEV